MNKILGLFLILFIIFSFTSCRKQSLEFSSFVSEKAYNTDINTSSISSSEFEKNTESYVSVAQSQTSAAKVSSDTSLRTSTPTNSTKCTHPDFWEGHTGLHFIGGWYDRKAGIENKFTLSAKCEEQRKMVYKCPICFEPVLVETLEPTGHDFSGKEEVLAYPTVNSEGSWGIRCQSPLGCLETKLTTTIPKRGGSYETIDSCFTISGNDYKIDNPYMIIMDRRTWGDVPTIIFDTSSCTGTISYVQKDGTLYQTKIIVDIALLNEGWRYKGTILESGEYDVQYSRWGAFDGATS